MALRELVAFLLIILLHAAPAVAFESRELIHGAVVEGNKLRFTVSSHGCTTWSHFRIDSEVMNGVKEITLVRTIKDFCRAKPSMRQIGFPLDRIGLEEGEMFVIMNRFAKDIVNPNEER